MIYIIGINSFIGKNLYIYLNKFIKNEKNNIVCMTHEEINNFNPSSEDTVINLCGINRAKTYDEYYDGNVKFLNILLSKLSNKPYLIHLSSMAVHGFVNQNLNTLDTYMQYFIVTKLQGEKILLDTYDNEKLLIVRPSNIYGYNCEPYYNNLLVTLVYEKINSLNKINNINKNCVRNFLSIDSLVQKIIEFIKNRRNGVINIMSSKKLPLDKIIELVYDGNIPQCLSIDDGTLSISNTENISGYTIYVDEDIKNNIILLEKQMIKYYELKNVLKTEHLEELIQPRGNMTEISNLEATRLYKITFTQHSIRGNHYHEKQIEDFFVNNGSIYCIFAHKDDTSIIYQTILSKKDKIRVLPNIIHTFVNDFLENEPEIFILSTHQYIKNVVLDTVYVTIF